MSDDDRWRYILELDDSLLKGSVILSEWCAFIVRETDTAFVAHAHLATIITAMAGIETYLRSEYATEARVTLYQLIEQSPLDNELRKDIHDLRKFRNRWVHVSDPNDDQELLDQPEQFEQELETMAKSAVSVLRRTIYENQGT
jgi:hypothetical protein